MSDESSNLCANCQRHIPTCNYEMHIVHCQRKIQLCPKCEEPVPRSELDEHDLEFHAQVKCADCRKTFEKSALDDHKAKKCPKRQKKCQYCELELKADVMSEHEEYCGSRTESCETCDKLVMMKHQQMHVESGHRKIRPDEDTQSSSSDTVTGAQAGHFGSPSRPPNHTQRVVNTCYPRRFDLDFDDELDVPLQNLELEHARNRATFRPAFTPRTDPPVAYQFPEEATPLIPCEFCEVPVAADELVLHQTGCRPDLVSSPPRKDERRQENAGVRRNSAFRPPIPNDNGILLPCEFCQKQFDLDFFAIHQSACQNRTAVRASNRHHEYYDDDDD